MDEAWDFISSPKNLLLITPQRMNLEICNKPIPEQMYLGLQIRYKIAPFLGIKLNWVTEIIEIESGSYFIDKQQVGVFRTWQHEHKISQTEDGILVEDTIAYSIPLGLLGILLDKFFVAKQLKATFEFRNRVMDRVLGR
jgi:ligand-binding SRPBCC domain-containing protein